MNVGRELEFFELGSDEEPLYQIAKEALFRHTRKQLADLEDIVLRDTLQRHRRPLTYMQLAEKLGYSRQRTTEVGAKLWAKLTDALGTAKISRKTAYSTLNQILDDQPSGQRVDGDAIALPEKSEELYVARSPIERNALGALMQPGGWFRMSGPEGMGKSTLLDQVLLELRRQDLQTVTVDFTLMGNGTFKDLRSLLKRFCLEVGRGLDLPNAMAEYWDEDCDLLQNATAYFEKYLLSDRTSPVVLVLDDVDQVFEHSDIRDDFCKLLVGWHRLGTSGRSKQRSKLWALLRVIVIHSTEVYVDWDIHHSPFLGVGTVERLSDFQSPQIRQMMDFFGVTLSDADLNELMHLIGGHPLLLTEAFKDLRDTGRLVEQLLRGATTDEDPFGNDLRRKFEPLEHSPDLWEGFRQVVEADEPVVLSNSVRYRLERMGLVRFVQTEAGQNACVNRYELYRRYFLNQYCGG